MGGSAYFNLVGGKSSVIPQVDFDVLKRSLDAIISAIDSDLVYACHDISDGGIGVCLSEMCIGGNVGAEIDITSIADIRKDFKLFSESNTRWLVEIKPGKESEFESKMKVPVYKIGKVEGTKLKIIDSERTLLELDVADIKNAWGKALWELMG
jgi:phosphoribosylformylglycinamidine synthase